MWEVGKVGFPSFPKRGKKSVASCLVAGTDGSEDERTEVMGAGYVLGADPLRSLCLSYLSLLESVALLPQLGRRRLVCYSCCGMCANGTAIKSTC